jgi:hypothetical protein
VAKSAGNINFSFEGLPGLKDALDRAAADIRAQVAALMEETAYAVRDDARANVIASTAGDGDLAVAIVSTSDPSFTATSSSTASACNRPSPSCGPPRIPI